MLTRLADWINGPRTKQKLRLLMRIQLTLLAFAIASQVVYLVVNMVLGRPWPSAGWVVIVSAVIVLIALCVAQSVYLYLHFREEDE